jgi:hypothetical protein
VKNVHKQRLDEMNSKLRAETQDKRSVMEKFTRDLRGKDDKIKSLEGSISAKDTEITTLKHGLRERNEDVNTLVPEVARLQTLNAEMKAVNDARLKEFSALKAEAERLKVEFEKGNKDNLATVQQLTAKLESEQSKHTAFIKKLEETAQAKADEINSLQNDLTAKTTKISDLERRLGSMNKMSTDLASLEEYRANTEKSIKRTIQALQNDLAKGKAEDAQKVARIKELERLQESMFGKDGEIQRLRKVRDYCIGDCVTSITHLFSHTSNSLLSKDLAASGEEISKLRAELNVSQTTNKKMAQDISEFKSVRYSSEASLKKTTDQLAVAQREIERLKREIEHLKQSDTNRTDSLKELERKLTEKELQLKSALASKESEVSSLNTSVSSFASERDRLLTEVEKLSEWKSSAEETIAIQCKKIEVINSQLQRMERDLKATPSSEYEDLLKERASLIERLAHVKEQLVQKNDKIKTTKIQTDNLLRRNNATYASSFSPGSSIRTARTPILSNNVVIGEFTTRRRNIATSDVPASVPRTTPIHKTSSASPGAEAPPKQAEKLVVSPPQAPTLSEISSNMAATLTQVKTAPPNTMSAYDLAIEKAQQAADANTSAKSKSIAETTTPQPETKTSTGPMSGWAGYKDSKWGGYFDNLSSSAKASDQSKDYKYKDSAQKGFGYLDNLSASKPTESPPMAPKGPDLKDEYLEAEKKYLLDAKNLALQAALSFQQAQSNPNDKGAMEKANAEKVKVNELLSKAKEMRAKAEEITKGT